MTIKQLSKLLPLLLTFTLLFSLTACGGGGGGGGVDDTTAPIVTAFTLPATSSSLIVAISNFTASDVGVIKYCLTETNSSSGCTWKDTPPNDYTFTTAGRKTLYAFATDVTGNISNSLSATTTITLTDFTAPTLSAFTLPTTSNSLDVAIISFTANDTVGVTGYCLAETANSSSCNWSTSAPASHTFTTAGSKVLYAFARDAAGNISNSLSASITITLTDFAAPTVTAFTLPTTSNNLNVAIASFIASDAVGVTGYCLAETNNSSGCTWSASAPTSFSFATAGSKTLYAFAKDAAGNVSTSRNALISLTITAKLTIGIQRIDTTQGTNVGSVDLKITLPDSFILEADNNGLPISTSPLVTGLDLQLNYAHPTLNLALIKGDATAFSTGNLVSFSRTLQNGEALPTAGSFQLELIDVSEISENGDVTIQTQDYETTLTIEAI